MTLIATDDESGVRETWIGIHLGGGAMLWERYYEPKIFSGLGDHEIDYFSIDNANNQEDTKTVKFKIVEDIPYPDLDITAIEGGKGVLATFENVGDADATNIHWDITIDKGFFFLSRKSSGNIATLESDQSSEIHMSIFGMGLGKIFELPIITIDIKCDEGFSAFDKKSINSTIFLSTVTLM